MFKDNNICMVVWENLSDVSEAEFWHKIATKDEKADVV